MRRKKNRHKKILRSKVQVKKLTRKSRKRPCSPSHLISPKAMCEGIIRGSVEMRVKTSKGKKESPDARGSRSTQIQISGYITSIVILFMKM